MRREPSLPGSVILHSLRKAPAERRQPRMRFAFAGIDFLGDVLETLIGKGWQPVKLFSRPCDGIYDFNDVTVARARNLKVSVQFSRIAPSDLASLKASGCQP